MTCPPSQSWPGVTWGPLAAPTIFLGAAVGAPLGEWRRRALPGSPSRVAGWAALAPPGWASWDTGRQLATQGGGPWSPRAPRLNGTGPAITGRVGPIGNRGWARPGMKPRGTCWIAACGLLWGWAIHPSSCLLSAWGDVPHGLAWPGVPTGPDRAPFRCLSRAASPRVRKLART